ncbi:5'-nucleotidase, lipoprotein e(P4) family [Flavobacterium circumlabens]|uniref:5'-nucleotidase (Lipoprotein e(P4) family) n=1 Tax=Flavobacterium circumlabens TaxID=2133765 RepID=A0A4Y7UBF7_9FLAO|nr:5'-nucleotidase, lipoprotein e(P4) family [Flavobacterium circumlabens]TCN55411.1 5'-nucleotidase (lipoprotein e(P4) family) [Flavobacterium circumlabens]TEB43169.1 5'-nucleotidase, lipoprotein e(P4) family [Flavobacterium circumlabens]
MKTKFKTYATAVLVILLLFSSKEIIAQDSVVYKSESQVTVFPVLWQQTSAEYRALCYQAFNFATLRLNEIPKKEIKKGNLAIITDLDETILDNSYVGAQLIKENKQMSDAEWNRWTNASKTTEVPGAVAFLQEASKKGITIFYISNRDTASVKTTLIDLKNLQLPNADAEHCLFKSNTSSKEVRRMAIEKEYKIVMLLGDNLNDFKNTFEKKSIADRFIATDAEQELWGKKFIVLPNATYGEWVSTLYNHEHKSDEEKEKIRRELLKGY